MNGTACELQFTRLELSKQAIELAAGLRVLFAVRGSAEVGGNGDTWPSRLTTDQATLGTTPVRLRSEEENTLLLSWEITVADGPGGDPMLRAPLDLDPAGRFLVRCDRVDFPPGGEALLHTHQGPGIRCLLAGRLDVTVADKTKRVHPLDPWFESGTEPVYAAASPTEPTAFVRVMVLPESLLGESSIRYVREEDLAKPKSQRYTVYLDEPVTLPCGATAR